MLRGLIQKTKLGSCKTKVSNDVNAFEESGEKKSKDVKNKWRIAASIAILNGMRGKMIFKECLIMKKLILKMTD